MKKVLLLVSFVFLYTNVFSQITINTDSPNNDISHLVNNVLLSSGVQVSNISYQGHAKQIGYFDGTSSNIGLNGGIVLSTGDVNILSPSFNDVPSSVGQTPPITDPDLLNVANSVPGLIGQSFTVSAINDVAVVEFDFIPSSDTVSFNYVFGSQEYFGYENSSFNDVFGFFVSGPGISGPYSSPAGFPDGSINVATFESQESNSLGNDLPITVSSICNNPNLQAVYNPQFFVNNQSFSTVATIDGFTVKMRAELIVQCGETYHIRLAIADGSDAGLASFVFLEEKSFSSTETNIGNDIGQNGTNLVIDCGEEVTLTAEVNSLDDYSYLWSTNETTQSISVGSGTYWFTASNDGCDLYSDTITVEEESLGVSLGDDISVCAGDSIEIGIKYLSGEAPYSYDWNTGQNTPEIHAVVGDYILTVKDANNCEGVDTISVLRIQRPTSELGGDGILCKGRDIPEIDISFTGTPPFIFSYTNGVQTYIDSTSTNSYQIIANTNGDYSILTVKDEYCEGTTNGIYKVRRNDFNSVISGGGRICEGDSSEVIIHSDLTRLPYRVYLNNGNDTKSYSSNTIPFSIYSEGDYIYTVEKIVDNIGCESITNSGLISVLYKDELEPQIITSVDSVLCPIDTLVELMAIPEGGVWYGKGVDFENNFNPINGKNGKNWVYYSFPNNCNETDSTAFKIGCNVSLFIPNSFTPNGDYDNEFLEYMGHNIIDFDFSIFNRWGEIMFQTNDITEFWDGKYKNRVVPSGVYSYVAKIYGKDAKYKFQNGTVNILK